MGSRLEHDDFFFEEQVVGYFEDHCPSGSGQYRYMPFRGLGHLRLAQALFSSGSQRCYFLTEGEKRYFNVLSMASRVLQVSFE